MPNRDALVPENTVFQEITGGYDPIVLGKRKVPARAYVAQFNFKGPDQEKKVGLLSGGERNRVHLAKLLKSGGNLLLLDEPTNDLDVDMLRALEEALLDFGGCAVVIVQPVGAFTHIVEALGVGFGFGQIESGKIRVCRTRFAIQIIRRAHADPRRVALKASQLIERRFVLCARLRISVQLQQTIGPAQQLLWQRRGKSRAHRVFERE